MNLATSRKWRDRNGNSQEDTQWHRVIVWGRQGEACKEHLNKGRKVYVEGRLQTRNWEDRDGNKRWTTEVVAERVQFLGGKGGGGSNRPDEPPPVDDDDVPF
jgi:single-strand DNA-binding protein